MYEFTIIINYKCFVVHLKKKNKIQKLHKNCLNQEILKMGRNNLLFDI